MPIYEYRCQQCGHELEKIQRMSDDPLSDCPQCEEPALKKLVSAAGFRLKGGGWYETDFKSEKKKNLVENSDSSTKSDKKPASSSSDTSAKKSTTAKKADTA